METTPVIVLAVPLIVYTPEPAVKVWLFVRFPENRISELPELFQVPPELTVTSPAKVFAPVADEIIKVPVIEEDPLGRANSSLTSKVPAVIVKSPTTRNDELAVHPPEELLNIKLLKPLLPSFITV